MIISPSISQVLQGLIHELGGAFKEGLNPVKSAQIDTVIGALGSCAMRADYQSKFIHEEANAITSLAQAYMKSGHGEESLKANLSAMDSAKDDDSLYQAASETLSTLSDIGTAAGNNLSGKLLAVFEQRLANEAQIIGGGFEAAGRG